MPWINQARAHWKEFRPKMYRELEKSGRLEEELLRASDQASEQIGDLVRDGMNLLSARELVLPNLIYLPPESRIPLLGEDPENDSPALPGNEVISLFEDNEEAKGN